MKYMIALQYGDYIVVDRKPREECGPLGEDEYILQKDPERVLAKLVEYRDSRLEELNKKRDPRIRIPYFQRVTVEREIEKYNRYINSLREALALREALQHTPNQKEGT